MPLGNYEELSRAISQWLARGDLDDAIPDFIRLAELTIQRRLNARTKDSKTTGTLVVGQDYISTPADLLEPVFLRIESNPLRTVEVVTLERLMVLKQNDSDSLPIGMSVVGTTIELAPTPDSATPYTLYYRAGPTALSPANPTNSLLTQYPDLYLYGALVESAPYLKDDARLQTWGSLFEDRLRWAKRQEGRGRTGGGPLRMRPDVFA